MIKILTETKEEYLLMKKFVEEKKKDGVFVDLYKPEDSVGSVNWSIEDVREHFPEKTSDKKIHSGLLNIEKSIKEEMIRSGWETIEALKLNMLENL
jgi:ribosomal protein S15P/S13E